MCGIAGYIGLKSFFPSKNNIKSCLKLMKLRGPDSQKTKEIYIKKHKALLLHLDYQLLILQKDLTNLLRMKRE